MGALIKNLFFLVTFGVILWFGYQIFFKSDDMALTVSANSEAAIAQRDFLEQLKELRDLELDASLFDDPEFLSLTDLRVEIVDEEAGRPNPFAPVPGLKLTDESTQ